jgi:retron-type reverse transcriptase
MKSMHPPLFPFLSRERCESYLSHAMNWPHEDIESVSHLLDRNLIPLRDGSELAYFLGISPRLVWHMVLNPQQYYRSFEIKQKNGKVRTITAPRVFLKTVQHYILDCVLSATPVSNSVHGFRKGKNCGSGAKVHVGRSYVWNIDIKDFFPSIDRRTVENAFRGIGYNERAASLLSGLCCLDGRLPQGAPTSPALSNIIFSPIDQTLIDLCQRASVAYTRYADDLTFSATSLIQDSLQRDVLEIIKQAGFDINPKKTRLMGTKCRREVTGLTVNEQVSIPRHRRRRMRALFHEARKNPSAFVTRRNELIGKASWVFNYHPQEGRRYLEIANAIENTA